MRLRACMLAIAVVTPLRAFAQTPRAGSAPPPPAAPPPPPPACRRLRRPRRRRPPLSPPPLPHPRPPPRPPPARSSPGAASSTRTTCTCFNPVDGVDSLGRRRRLGRVVRHEHQQRHARSHEDDAQRVDGSGRVPARPGLRRDRHDHQRRQRRSATPPSAPGRQARRAASSCCRRTAPSRVAADVDPRLR